MAAAEAMDLPALNAQTQKLIVVTGFGPFIGHEEVNASWEAVKLLPDVYTFKDIQYLLQKKLVPVEYAAVDSTVADIWTQNPELVIHCGVHGLAKCVYVEKLAYNNKFTRQDYAGNCLCNAAACISNDKDVITTGLNVHKIVRSIERYCGCNPISIETINSTKKDTLAKPSYDVGGYLCGYIYLKSLDNDRNRTLFLHVPPIDEISSARACQIIENVIQECLRQVTEELPNQL